MDVGSVVFFTGISVRSNKYCMGERLTAALLIVMGLGKVLTLISLVC